MGKSNFSMPLIILEEKKKSASGYLMPIVLGSVSPNISSITVLIIVAKSTPLPSPIKPIKITVNNAAKAVFTKLLTRSIVGKTLSGSSIILATRSAPDILFSTILLILTLLRDKNAASELEKKADNSRQGSSRIK